VNLGCSITAEVAIIGICVFHMDSRVSASRSLALVPGRLNELSKYRFELGSVPMCLHEAYVELPQEACQRGV